MDVENDDDAVALAAAIAMSLGEEAPEVVPPVASVPPVAPAPPAAAALSSAPPASMPAPLSGSKLTAGALAAALAALSGGYEPPSATSLVHVLPPDRLVALTAADAALRDALLPFCPPGQATPEALPLVLHSPQFRQALSTMTGALDSGNLPAVCAMFGLSFEDAAAAPGANGDTTAMLIAAIQASVRRANAATEPAAGTPAAGTRAADTVVVETAADAAAAPTGTSEGESKAGAQQ